MSATIRDAVRDAGLAGQPVCIHASLRSFSDPRPDAGAVIDAFLSEECSVMVYTSSHGTFGVMPPPDLRPGRNGCDYDDPDWTPAGGDRVFDPSLNDVDESLGALSRVLLRRPERVRGNHPIASFAAVGPHAGRLIAKQAPLRVYAPLEALVRLGGNVVLMGVGLNRMTLIHLAEKRSGRTLFRRWANGPDGEPMMVEAGSCSEGFGNLEPALRPVRRTVVVGGSRWQIYPAAPALRIATHAIRRNQRITHCGEDCVRCDDATAGGPVL